MPDFGSAEVQFKKILAIDPFRIDDIDVYSNILYVTENRLDLSKLAHDFLALDKDRPEVCCLVGKPAYSKRLNPPPTTSTTIREPLFPARRTREGCQVLPKSHPTGSDIPLCMDADGA